MTRRLGPGRPEPLGVTPEGGGVNVAVFSANATRVLFCVFDGAREVERIPLPERTGDIWHGHVADIPAGTRYGLRVEGDYAPAQGHRFNPAKLLIDPYARALDGELAWKPEILGYQQGAPGRDHLPDRRDSAPFVPKCVVTKPLPPAEEDRPETPWWGTVIYEAHARGLTMRMEGVENPGTYAALGHPKVIAHLKDLGVTALELLPVHGFIEDAHLAGKGLTNYWGYQTLTFFAPQRRYAATDDPAAELRQAIRALHGAGIEVILDVVYNHSCEGDGHGPTLIFRGLDNARYYRLGPDGHSYDNDTGTGNVLNCAEPGVQRMVLDSLRYWAGHFGVDGFRFDLGTVLGREGRGFDPGAGLLDAMRADPLLARVKLIAEPWDIGPGGYQLGGFPPPFGEWNDVARDTMRRFWRGDPGQAPVLSGVIAGSAHSFDRDGRPATSSVNFLTAHDGFTLMDVVSYDERHNEANLEDNQDGHGENFSDNMGAEGETGDEAIQAARARRRRAMMATLLFAQGTPMLLAGDEIGNSQGGNNNAYVQDNDIGWVDWPAADADFLTFVQRAVALRGALPMLGQSRFLHSEIREDGHPDLIWHHPEGREMQDHDWQDEELRLICVEKRMAASTPAYAQTDEAAFLVLNAGEEARVVIPDNGWALRFWSAEEPHLAEGVLTVPGQSVALLTSTPA